MRKAHIVVGLLVTVLTFLGACESAPTPAPTPAPAPAPAPAPLPATPHTLDDLACIQAEGRPYSDDADPESEGAEITILWYDTKSELIFFEDVPVKATIEIFAAKSEVSLARYTESVYKGEHHIDNYHSNIRIPFEQIKASPEIHYSGGRANIVVNTPQQGGFSVENILLPLYPKQPLKPPPIPAPMPAPAPPSAPPEEGILKITEIGKNLAVREMKGGGYPEVLDAAVAQDEHEVSLALIVQAGTPEARAKELGFIFVSALIEYELEGGCLEGKRPYPNWETKEIGEGIFDYLVTVTSPDGGVIVQGAKVSFATHITW